MILIISNDQDGHTRMVMDTLARQGYPYYLLDLSNFPANGSLSMEYSPNHFSKAYFKIKGENISFDNFGSIWWRRPQPYTLHQDVSGALEKNFSLTECYAAVNGLWLLTNASWINHPVNDEVASRKAYQLKVATDCGMTIPATLVTNDPTDATNFITQYGVENVIYKSFLATEQTWRETRLIKNEELEKMDNVKYAPVIFQECIHSDIDMRVTIIGDTIFPAAIHSKDTSYKFDFRMNYHECKIVQHDLPEQLNRQLLKFMKRLGIVYGAVDLRLRPNGEYVFLEVNPAGQWLFMEEPTGMPITEKLVQTLIESDQVYHEKQREKPSLLHAETSEVMRF